MSDVVDRTPDNPGLDRPSLRAAAMLARRQGGVISFRQLRALGFSRGAIEHWLHCGRLYRVFRGVYALGHEAITPKGWLMAAVLACGEGAVISHTTAAMWWGFWKGAQPKDIHVTVPGRSRKGQKGLKLHLVRDLDPRDVTTRYGVPITGPARTLLDLAETVPLWKLRLAVDEADRRNLFDADAAQRLLQRSPGRRGRKPLSTLLSDFEDIPLLRSELELLFSQICDPAGLPRPVTNTEVEGMEVDAYWPEHDVIVELDSREHHLNGKAFEDDRLKIAVLAAAGHRVIPVTHRQIKTDLEGVRARLRRALAR